MWTQEDLILAKATECETMAEEAIDLSVRRYFAKLARDYRYLAELAAADLSEQSLGSIPSPRHQLSQREPLLPPRVLTSGP